MSAFPHAIVHNEAQSRFETSLGGMTAFVEYVRMARRVIFTHTEVPAALEGQGIGSQLTRHVMDYARDNGLQVVPLCPFIASWIREHPEHRDLVVPGFAV